MIDTNVLASAVFFGGNPYLLIKLILEKRLTAVASQEIVDEYTEIVERFQAKSPQMKANTPLEQIISRLDIIEVKSNIRICRDSDDDKFISCAVDGKCTYIVSGDKDLLTLEKYEDIEILTVTDFLEEYASISV